MALVLLICFLSVIFLTLYSAPFANCENTIIVQMDNNMLLQAFANHIEWYQQIVKKAAGNTEKAGRPRIYYVYTATIDGFAAELSTEEAGRLKRLDGMIHVYPDKTYVLHTTRSPEFLGLSHSHGLWPQSNYGEDVIVGVVDSGIWPESLSFKDDGFSPVPATWRGECVEGAQFSKYNCNRKLIGARFFFNGTERRGDISSIINSTLYGVSSPRDTGGHGTHCASTAVGSAIPNAGLQGFASGTASGIAPKARLASYKACWRMGCLLSDIASAINAAINDGVHVLSLSIGMDGDVYEYNKDPVAVFSFAAVRKGIFVAVSAVNEGSGSGTVKNDAPWMTNVGAGSIDRKFPAKLKLGDGSWLEGESLFADANMLKSQDLVPIVRPESCEASDLRNLMSEGRSWFVSWASYQKESTYGKQEVWEW